ncbi:MAG: ribokinase [Chloroflexi bacterium]|nr:ribokinase [Chloroflexota bacterium]
MDPVDYLVIGHITQDLTPAGPTPGGTAAYAALAARALGLRVGIVTSLGPGAVLGDLSGFPTANLPAPASTTFRNQYTPAGRVQHLCNLALPLDYSAIPAEWRSAPIVHLGPVAREVDPALAGRFPRALVGLTPQGWLREWEPSGLVRRAPWPQAEKALRQAAATVLSIEDVQGDEITVEDYAHACPVTVVTEGELGARVYWNTHVRRFSGPTVTAVDSTGAGDVFAAAFFARLHQTRDPYEAGRFAALLAAASVTRPGLAGAPTAAEIAAARVELLGSSWRW